MCVLYADTYKMSSYRSLVRNTVLLVMMAVVVLMVAFFFSTRYEQHRPMKAERSRTDEKAIKTLPGTKPLPPQRGVDRPPVFIASTVNVATETSGEEQKSRGSAIQSPIEASIKQENQQKGEGTGLQTTRKQLSLTARQSQSLKKPWEVVVSKPERFGYITALEYWDQQTYSIENILSLQAFASWVGVRVPEPFLVETRLGLPVSDEGAFHEDGNVSYLTMSDVYDLRKYNRESGGYSSSVVPLTPWKTFFETAARDVVFVNVNGMSKPYQNIPSLNKTLVKMGFKLRRVFKLDVKSGKGDMSEKDLKAEVYRDGLLPSKVTVIFSSWSNKDFPGVFVDSSLHMIYNNYVISFKPSIRVLQDVDRYKSKYMKSFGNDYIGILVRAEWLILVEEKRRKGLLQSCLRKSVLRLRDMINKSGTSKVFVGMDIGRYGSKTMDDLNRDHIKAVGEEFLQSAYQDRKMTLDSWENTFTEVSSSLVPGYVANLEKLIAVQGRCLMLIGFGSFQSNALRMYEKRHPTDQCISRTDMSCNLISLY